MACAQALSVLGAVVASGDFLFALLTSNPNRACLEQVGGALLSRLVEGELVRVCADYKRVMRLQMHHGGVNERMVPYCGELAAVKKSWLSVRDKDPPGVGELYHAVGTPGGAEQGVAELEEFVEVRGPARPDAPPMRRRASESVIRATSLHPTLPVSGRRCCRGCARRRRTRRCS